MSIDTAVVILVALDTIIVCVLGVLVNNVAYKVGKILERYAVKMD